MYILGMLRISAHFMRSSFALSVADVNADICDKGPPLYTNSKFSKNLPFLSTCYRCIFSCLTFLTENKSLVTYISNMHYIYAENTKNSVLNHYKRCYFQHPHPRMSKI